MFNSSPSEATRTRVRKDLFGDTPTAPSLLNSAPPPITHTIEENILPQPKRTLLGTAGDLGVSTAKGVIGLGEATVGLADIATFGLAGKGLEQIGYDPQLTHEILDDFYSPAQQFANKEVEKAKGFTGTAAAMVKNPSTIAKGIVETTPQMLGGGAIGRMVKLGPVIGSAIGEGMLGAGSAAESTRQQTEDGTLSLKQNLASVASGLGTGALTLIGGRIAQKLGFDDVDSLLAGSGITQSADDVVKKIVGAGISEGVFEELPQSIQETVWSNVALNRPLLENVPEAAAEGMVLGAAMGSGAHGGSAAINRFSKDEDSGPEPLYIPELGKYDTEIEHNQYNNPIIKRAKVRNEIASRNHTVEELRQLSTNQEALNKLEITPFDVEGIILRQDLDNSAHEMFASDKNQLQGALQANREVEEQYYRSNLPATQVTKQNIPVDQYPPLSVPRDLTIKQARLLQDGQDGALSGHWQEQTQSQWPQKIDPPPPKEEPTPKSFGPPSTAQQAAEVFGDNSNISELEKRLNNEEKPEQERTERRHDAEVAFSDSSVLAMPEHRPLLPALDKMEQELSQGDQGKVFDKSDGTTSPKISTYPEWFKQKTVAQYNKDTGEEISLSQKNVSHIIRKIRKGLPLTNKQTDIWHYLESIAEKHNSSAPDLVANSEYERIEKEGFELDAPKDVFIGELDLGDQIVVEDPKTGLPDVLTHQGRRDGGNIVLQDGMRYDVDEFDTIPVIGIKKGSVDAISADDAIAMAESFKTASTEEVNLFLAELDSGEVERNNPGIFQYEKTLRNAAKARITDLETLPSNNDQVLSASLVQEGEFEQSLDSNSKDLPTDKSSTTTPQANDLSTTDQERAKGPAETSKQVKKKADQTNTVPIEDFGEVLVGARKHYAEKLNNAKNEDIAIVPLSKSFPEPKYEQLLKKGISPDVAALVRAMRDDIPNKPRNSRYKLKEYTEAVSSIRDLALSLLKGELAASTVKNRMNSHSGFLRISGRADLYKELGHHKSFKGITFQEHHYSLYRGEKNVTKWVIEKKGKSTAFSNMPTELGVGNTRQEALESFKERLSVSSQKNSRKPIKYDVYRYNQSPELVWVGKTIGGRRIDIKSFTDTELARDFVKNNQNELADILKSKRYTPNIRRKSNEERIGTDYRDGKDVSPDLFDNTFGFRGVQFGNWVGKKVERQNSLNNAYDALLDLANILNVPPKAISLNGQLGLAFGARGRGAINPAAAHYEADNAVINLTKKQGAGSLAHEWLHALDNYLGQQGGENTWVTESARSSQTNSGDIRSELFNAYKELVQTIYSKTDVLNRSTALGKYKSKKGYYDQDIEIMARLFENFIIDQSTKSGDMNDYLANVISENNWKSDWDMMLASMGEENFDPKKYYPYANKDELKTVSDAFAKFFKVIKTKETDNGVALYSKQNNAISRTRADIVNEIGASLGAKAANHIFRKGGISIIETQEEAERIINKGHSKDTKTQGFYHNNQIYLVADAIPVDHSVNVLNHELGVHANKLLIKDKSFNRVLSSLPKRAEKTGKTPSLIKEAFARIPEDTKPEYVNEEALAYLIENHPEVGFVRQVIAKVKSILVDIGFPANLLKPKDLRALAQSAVRGGKIGTSDKRVLMKSVTESTFQDVDTNSPEFQKWFDGSSVVDETGKPLVMYHGSPEYFTTFNSAESGKNTAHGSSGLGFFFTQDKNLARRYAGQQGHVVPTYLALKNPYTMTLKESQSFNNTINSIIRQKELISQGYDGVVMDFSKQGVSPYIIAFDSTQIKSATTNTGEFSKEDPDIRYSKATTEDVSSSVLGLLDHAKRKTKQLTDSGNSPEKQDLGFFERILSSFEWISSKSPAAERMLKAQLDRRDNAFKLESEIVDSFGAKLDDYKKKSKKDYQEANSYLLEIDRTGKGYSVTKAKGYNVVDKNGEVIASADTNEEVNKLISDLVKEKYGKDKSRLTVDDYKAVNREGWVVLDRENVNVGEFDSNEKAVETMLQAELDELKESGMAQPAIEMVSLFRGMTNRAFDKMVIDLNNVITEIKASGLDEPTVESLDESKRWKLRKNGKNWFFETEESARAVAGPKDKLVRQKDDQIRAEFTLTQMIAQMSDLRGTYFPRQRDNGAIILRATKEGEPDFLQKYDAHALHSEKVDKNSVIIKRPATALVKNLFNETTAHIPFIETLEKKKRELKRKGYETFVNRDISSPESVFDATSLVASMDSLLQTAKEKSGNKEAARAVSGEITKELANIFKGRGYLSSRISRSEQYTVGFEEDMLLAGMQYAKGLSAGLAKKQSAKEMVLALMGRDIPYSKWQSDNPDGSWAEYDDFVKERRLDPNKQKAMHGEAMSWMKEMLRNDERVDRVLGTIKGLAVLKFLGFRVSSAAVNATNMVQAVPATISDRAEIDLSSALNHIRKAGIAYGKYRSGKGQLSQEDREIFAYISENGWDEAQFNHENAHILQSKLGRAYTDIAEFSMKLFGAVEKANRAATIYAAYKALESSSLGRDDRFVKAKEISDASHGIYGKATMPSWTRGAWNPAKLFFVFQKFSQNYALNMVDMGLRGQHKQAAYMLLSPAILAGAGASAVTPLLAKAIGLIKGDDDDYEEKFYDWVTDMFGETGSRYARHGLAGGILGVNLKGSLQMNNPMPKTLAEVGGAPASMIQDVGKAWNHAKDGEYLKAGERMLPTGIGSVLKGAREHIEGATTGSYSPVFFGNEPLKSDGIDATMRILGFNPSTISGAREKQWKEYQVKDRMQKRRAKINAQIRKFYIFNNGSQEEIIKSILKYNELAKGLKRTDIRPINARKQIKNAIRRASKPNQLERNR